MWSFIFFSFRSMRLVMVVSSYPEGQKGVGSILVVMVIHNWDDYLWSSPWWKLHICQSTYWFLGGNSSELFFKTRSSVRTSAQGPQGNPYIPFEWDVARHGGSIWVSPAEDIRWCRMDQWKSVTCKRLWSLSRDERKSVRQIRQSRGGGPFKWILWNSSPKKFDVSK